MNMRITNEQAYVLGLLIGGGEVANNTFVINMPFDKWGTDPTKAAEISIDLLTKVRKIFYDAYKMDIGHEIGNNGKWIIKPLNNPSLSTIIQDLNSLGLPISGVLLNSVNLTLAKASLTGIKAEQFLAGIFDAKASLADSHRRFNDDAPVVSIEVAGSTKNFNFVVQLCSWLTDLGSVTDQILFNHPSQQSPSDPTYSGWKKGFKIRFLVKSFIANHSFAMKAKATSVNKLAKKQVKSEQVPCNQRAVSANTLSIHNDIDSSDLPIEVRNKLFLHYHHICAVMGCPYAPIDNIQKLMPEAKLHISATPLLSKGGYIEMAATHQDLLKASFSSSTIIENKMTCSEIIEVYPDAEYHKIKSALAYILASELNGKRHVGNQDEILAKNSSEILIVREISVQDKAPIFIGLKSNDRGVVVSCPSGGANQLMLNTKIKIQGININVQ